MNSISELMKLMPPGVRFHPTDKVLIDDYLKPKILGKDDPQVCDVIPEIDVCKYEPWDLPHIFEGNSVIKTDDQEWFFFCPLLFKYSKSNRSNRATKSGFWKVTGKDQEIKARCTNNVIGTKKFLVFYKGRVRNGVKTDWVMHEYHPPETLPNQRAFVICRVKNKAADITNVSTCDGGESSSSNAIPAPQTELGSLFFQPETELGSHIQLHDHDFSPSQQPPMNNQQLPFLEDFSFANAACSNERIRLTEQEEEFVSSLIVEPVEYSSEKNTHTLTQLKHR